MTRKKKTVVAAATRLFAEKGFKETSIAEIARSSRVAEGTVFYHFKNKEDLLLFILKTIKEDILREFEEYRRSYERGRGIDLAEQAVSFHLYVAGKLEDQFLLLHNNYIYQLAKSNDTCRSYLQEIYDCLVDIFERAILLGQRDGTIGDAPARKTAMLIFTMVDGLVRFDNLNLYRAAALQAELVAATRRMLERKP